MGAHSFKEAKKNRALFIKQFLERPTEVASIVPSSEDLVKELIADIEYHKIEIAVEYGPGTGVITLALRPLLPHDSKYIAAEPNQAFREHLESLGLNIQLLPDYAQKITDKVLNEHGTADLVVSGIPSSVLSFDSLRELIASTHKILRNGGEFRMFIYTHTLLMPKIHSMLEELENRFSEVETEAVWLNFPPALVIKCTK